MRKLVIFYFLCALIIVISNSCLSAQDTVIKQNSFVVRAIQRECKLLKNFFFSAPQKVIRGQRFSPEEKHDLQRSGKRAVGLFIAAGVLFMVKQSLYLWVKAFYKNDEKIKDSSQPIIKSSAEQDAQKVSAQTIKDNAKRDETSSQNNQKFPLPPISDRKEETEAHKEPLPAEQSLPAPNLTGPYRVPAALEKEASTSESSLPAPIAEELPPLAQSTDLPCPPPLTAENFDRDLACQVVNDYLKENQDKVNTEENKSDSKPSESEDFWHKHGFYDHLRLRSLVDAVKEDQENASDSEGIDPSKYDDIDPSDGEPTRQRIEKNLKASTDEKTLDDSDSDVEISEEELAAFNTRAFLEERQAREKALDRNLEEQRNREQKENPENSTMPSSVPELPQAESPSQPIDEPTSGVSLPPEETNAAQDSSSSQTLPSLPSSEQKESLSFSAQLEKKQTKLNKISQETSKPKEKPKASWLKDVENGPSRLRKTPEPLPKPPAEPTTVLEQLRDAILNTPALQLAYMKAHAQIKFKNTQGSEEEDENENDDKWL